MQHTFQVGDRVVDTIDGAKGTVNRRNEHGHWLVLRDDRLAYSWSPYFSCREEVLRHDTDLRKGDWVRYVAVDRLALRKDGIRGKITHICDTDSIAVDWGGGDIVNHNRKYLVKIQPPVIFNDCYVHESQEEPMQERQEDAIERGIKEKIQLLERQVEKAKCCLETYRDLKVLLNKGESHGTR